MTDAVQIVLAKRPAGDVTADCFRRETIKLPALANGQVLIRSRFLSLDPYMRPRMTETRSYVPPFELDKPLTGGSVGEVIESRNERYAKGDVVMGLLDWATHTVHDGKGLRKIDPNLAPLRFRSPIPTRSVSSEEFMPAPQSPKQREFEARVKAYGSYSELQQSSDSFRELAQLEGRSATA